MITYIAKMVVCGKMLGITTTDLEAFKAAVRVWQQKFPNMPIYLFEVLEK